MEKKIYDQWQEGGWDAAFGDFIKNLCTFKTGFLKRCYRKSKALKYTDEGKVVVEDKVRMEFEAPHPFDIYPASNARNIKDYSRFYDRNCVYVHVDIKHCYYRHDASDRACHHIST